jgi:hypothetical protein
MDIQTGGLVQRIKTAGEALKEAAQDMDLHSGSTGMVEMALDRLSILPLLEDTIAETPEHIPYWQGHTYLPLFWKLIPVAIYPAKPPEISGQEFPHRYGLLRVYDVVTVVQLPQLVEAYINFGASGIVLVMFIIGVIYRAVEGLFVHRTMGFGAVVCSALVLGQWFAIDHTFSQTIGGIFSSMIALGCLHLAIETGERCFAEVGRSELD